MFGSPDHTRVTIHFLHAVLKLPQPITWVEILNPIQGQDRAEDKLVVLDVLAADLAGRRFNIEMQTTLPTDLPKRLTYYNCLRSKRCQAAPTSRDRYAARSSRSRRRSKRSYDRA